MAPSSFGIRAYGGNARIYFGDGAIEIRLVAARSDKLYCAAPPVMAGSNSRIGSELTSPVVHRRRQING